MINQGQKRDFVTSLPLEKFYFTHILHISECFNPVLNLLSHKMWFWLKHVGRRRTDPPVFMVFLHCHRSVFKHVGCDVGPFSHCHLISDAYPRSSLVPLPHHDQHWADQKLFHGNLDINVGATASYWYLTSVKPEDTKFCLTHNSMKFHVLKCRRTSWIHPPSHHRHLVDQVVMLGSNWQDVRVTKDKG